MPHPAWRRTRVRVVIQDETGSVVELRFSAASSDDELLVKLRERCDLAPGGEQGGIRTEERDGETFTVETLPPDRKLRPPTERQKGRRIAEGRLTASRNRKRARRCRRLAS